MISARKAAFEILLKIQKEKAYSNLVLENSGYINQLDSRDKALVSALVYGVIERQITLDYQLSLYLSKPLSKLKNDVLCILRLGAYQILFMEKIPQSAAVNESVKLSKSCCSYASSLINAVLRKVSKNGLVLPDEEQPTYLSVKYSCPQWLIEKWFAEYGKEDTIGILSSSVEKKGISIRVNTLLTDTESLRQKLEEENVICGDGTVEDSLVISSLPCSIDKLEAFKNGLFHVQDTASMLCAKAVAARSKDTVFDLCSAPGGKTFTIAEMMNNCGKIKAFDKYESRTGLIESGAKRLGISIVEAGVGDASVYNEKIGKADKVLCDVPCSGLGIIRQKPEIKYKPKESLDGLFEIQYSIIKNASSYVKDRGRLIYSTCSLSKDENEKVCEKFLAEHKNFTAVKPLPEIFDECFVTLMPHKNGCDGFFIAAFEKGD